jgi:hypothetical protein
MRNEISPQCCNQQYPPESLEALVTVVLEPRAVHSLLALGVGASGASRIQCELPVRANGARLGGKLVQYSCDWIEGLAYLHKRGVQSGTSRRNLVYTNRLLEPTQTRE